MPSQLTQADTGARDQMIRSSALQEHIIANAPVLPASISVHQQYFLYGKERHTSGEDADVVVMVSEGPEVITAYQDMLGGEFRQTTREDGRVETELRGRAYGASFRVWHLSDFPAKAVA